MCCVSSVAVILLIIYTILYGEIMSFITLIFEILWAILMFLLIPLFFVLVLLINAIISYLYYNFTRKSKQFKSNMVEIDT